MSAPSAAPRFDFALKLALPVAGLILLLDLIDGVARGATMMWNEVRLARAFALARGLDIYPGQHAHAPIIGTLHAPLGHLLYAGLAFLHDPTTALVAGCALSTLACFAPMFWIHWRAAALAGAGSVAALCGLFACMAVALASPGMRYIVFHIHVDAAALCLTLLAAGTLAFGGRPGSWTLAISAALGVLVVGCKQTLIPVPVALACFALVAHGLRPFLRYVFLQIIAGLVTATAILIAFRPLQDFLFNIWILPLHRGRSGTGVLEGISGIRQEAAIVAAPLVLLCVMAIVFRKGGLRRALIENPWTIFLFTAAFELPFALRALATTGGRENHRGFVTLLITIAVTTGLVGLWDKAALVARALLAGVLLAQLYVPWQIGTAIAEAKANPATVAFRYERQHPGRGWFLLNPLAVLMAGGKLTHFDPALVDREVGGFPVTADEFAAGLPRGYELIAWPASYSTPASEATLELLKSKRATTEPGLEGWNVYR